MASLETVLKNQEIPKQLLISNLFPEFETVKLLAIGMYTLRRQGIIIDMFYEDGLWSGRVYKLNDEEQRWKSCSSNTYEETLEMMLELGNELT